ncbi:MAG: PAS domain S-box protein [Bacteroidetes bacterium]|nr:PAS domain S-box protein [Bacteroidota bacterium]
MDNINRSEIIDTVFKDATEGIIVSDMDGYIRMANSSAARMLGYTDVELHALKIEDIVPSKIRGRHHQHRENYNKELNARPMGAGLDLYAERKDGTQLPVEISLSPVQIKGKKFIVAFIIDITVRKGIEVTVNEKQQELERVAAALITTNEGLEKKVSDRTKVLQEAIRELEKSRNELKVALEKEKDLNDLKSRFISMASHEFRTPLTTILSSASLISEYVETSNNDKREKHISRIKSAVNNLNDILSDFLSLSKLEEGKIHTEYRKFDLPHLVIEVVSDLQLNAKVGQEIVYQHEGNTEVILDSKLIKNILINLINNAVKFSPENKKINVSTIVNDDSVSFEIKDQGIGISLEDQKHLFERFFRAKNAFNIQGTGLGLHIVGSYVDLMNGSLELNSELEKGTAIKITFFQQK